MGHGLVRVAAAVPGVCVGDCAFNAGRILDLLRQAQAQGVAVAVFPELSLTGYTCGDLFAQTALLDGALKALTALAHKSGEVFSGLAVVGLPLVVDDRLFNGAAVLHRGRVRGVVPKSYIPNYKEYYECRWFAPADCARGIEVEIGDERVPFGTDLLFDAGETAAGLIVGVEICEDLWVPIPPSARQALAGANVLLNLSASNEVIGKAAYRRNLVLSQSGRCLAAYVYASSGVSESTTDLVFGGHCLIAENGVLLGESARLQREETLLVRDVDLARLRNDRLRTNSFLAPPDAMASARAPMACRRIAVSVKPASSPPLLRDIEAHPFVPRQSAELRERCHDIFQTQVAGLARRLEHIGKPPVAIGVSGGLDSTLALLVTCKTFDALAAPRANIRALTMPGFGTSPRTRKNAHTLMKHLGVAPREIDIRQLCIDEMRALGQRPFGIDLTGLSVEEFNRRLQSLSKEQRQDVAFENVQARMRTSLLMNTGFVVGTGDLSELALGWCTYNADHMSMYNPNISIPKTLVKFLVRWAAENEFAGEVRQTLLDVVATVISPELLPPSADGSGAQDTEQSVGPYELHDFFLFHFLRYGAPPEKILFLAEQARFDLPYSPSELRHWLTVFIQRFFANQFKRSCLPDGPKVGTVCLSPRGDWRMPSDADATLWLQWAERA